MFSYEDAAFLHETLIDGLSHVDYLWIIEIFLSAVWSLLTAPIHCRESIGEQVM